MDSLYANYNNTAVKEKITLKQFENLVLSLTQKGSNRYEMQKGISN
jgi:hypothetical protein